MRLSIENTIELEKRLADARADRRAITNGVKRAGRTKFDDLETIDFRELSATIEELEATLAEVKEERARSDSLQNATSAIYNRAGGGDTVDRGPTDGVSKRWAQDAANALHRLTGESRAVISGSVDVPIQVPLSPTQFQLPFPARLIDALPNRISIDSYAFDYYRQTTRVNAAAPVADLAQKPVSQFTVELVSGQAQIIATLTQPAPLRVWFDFQTLVDWLQIQSIGAVWDAVETEVISGSGVTPHQTGILNTSGTTNIGVSADIPTTLRSAVTAMQNLGEKPTAWCLNPIDAEQLDLIRWTSGNGGYLTGGFMNDAGGFGGSSDNILGPANQISRVITPHLPAGVALLGDFRELALFMRHSVRIDVATQGNPTGTQDLFGTNAFVIRAEVPIGVGVLRPQAFAVIALPGGS